MNLPSPSNENSSSRDAGPLVPSVAGVLLFAHGARDPRWALPFHDVARRLREMRPGLPVSLAYLEFMAPSLLQAGEQLAAEGCTDVTVVPLFLGAGGHVRKDLPALLAELSERHPGVTWQLQPAIGEIPSVVQAMAEAALELAGAPAAPERR